MDNAHYRPQRHTLDVASHIAGEAVRGKDAVRLVSPFTGQPLGSVWTADAAIVDQAVAVAARAQLLWEAVAPAQRARHLMKFREIVESRKQQLAEIINREHGKPIPDALGSIQRGVEVIEFAVAAPHLLKGENSEHVATGVATRSSKKPIGVCVGITPYNYPAMIPLWMFPLALACGNSFILKPSEQTPSAANMLVEMLEEAGVPKGVLNVVHGGRDVAEQLIAHPGVASVSFVGSTPVAAKVYEKAAAAGKRVQALGGAKNHAIIMPDADMERTVEALLNGAFNSAGQRCMAISVVVTVGNAGDLLLPQLREAAGKMRVGLSETEDCDVPPLSTKTQFDKVCGLVDAAAQGNATLSIDGRAQSNGEAFAIGPTIFENVTADMSIYREEVFGPVLAVLNVETLDDAIALSNAHELGNGAVIFTSSGKSADLFERKIKAGMIGVNVPVPSPVSYYSFGGWKKSLFGDLAMHGPDALNFFTRRQVLTTRW